MYRPSRTQGTFDHFVVAAHWGSRRESLDECATRAGRLLISLRGCDPIFSQWVEFLGTGTTWTERAVQLTEKDLKAILSRGQNRRDTDGSPIPELGFGVGLSTPGKQKESAHVSVHCGAYSRYVGNDCLIELPSEGPAALRLLRMDALKCILSSLVASWNPDMGVVTSSEFQAQVGTLTPGWLTYLKKEPDALGSLPAPSRATPFGSGVLVVMTEELLSANNPAHLELARLVTRSLE